MGAFLPNQITATGGWLGRAVLVVGKDNSLLLS